MNWKRKAEARAILRNAADLIDTYGWTTGSYGNPATGFCALGAIEYAAHSDGIRNVGTWLKIHFLPKYRRRYRAELQARWLLRREAGRICIWRWNDSRGCRWPVVDAMRAAAGPEPQK